MGPDARLVNEYEQAVAVQGARFAAAMWDGDAGDPDEHRGWRGQLQMAADFSGQDPEILALADDLYASLGHGASVVVLERFLLRWSQVAVRRYPRRFLEGALAYLATRREIIDLRL